MHFMHIHPLWFVCLLVRCLLVYTVFRFHHATPRLLLAILFTIGVGFLFKALTGSNDDKRVFWPEKKVFWHDARSVHAVMYLMASGYLLHDNVAMACLILALNVIFSVIYRVTAAS
jgi:hypothetical protein